MKPALFSILVCLAPASELAAETRLGAAPSTDGAIEVSAAVAKQQHLVGKKILVRGRIAEVCQMAGCWVALRDENGKAGIRVKVADGEIVFPKESLGKTAVVEGKLERFTLTREQAIAREKHEAEEQGRKPRTVVPEREWTFYQIAGTGAVLFD